MNGKDSSDETTRPRVVRHLCEQNKKQNRGEAVPEHIDQMLRARIQAEQLTIQHVRDRGQRMPVLGVDVGEGPTNSGPTYARTHVGVVVNIQRIVVVDELVVERLPEYRPCDRGQEDGDAESGPP